MKLLAVGDSFTYGEELDDISLAWPYILGKMIDYSVTNLGQPASSNDKIIGKAVKRSREFDLVIIAWSHYARFEMADSDGIYDIWPGSNPDVHDYSQHRKQLVDYVSRYHNDIYDYERYLSGIILLQSYFKAHDIRYVMLNSFGNNYRELSERHNFNELEQQIDRERFIGWPDDQMVEWTYGCPKGPQGHFLNEGHRKVAEKIYEHIRNLSWVS